MQLDEEEEDVEFSSRFRLSRRKRNTTSSAAQRSSTSKRNPPAQQDYWANIFDLGGPLTPLSESSGSSSSEDSGSDAVSCRAVTVHAFLRSSAHAIARKTTNKRRIKYPKDQDFEAQMEDEDEESAPFVVPASRPRPHWKRRRIAVTASDDEDCNPLGPAAVSLSGKAGEEQGSLHVNQVPPPMSSNQQKRDQLIADGGEDSAQLDKNPDASPPWNLEALRRMRGTVLPVQNQPLNPGLDFVRHRPDHEPLHLSRLNLVKRVQPGQKKRFLSTKKQTAFASQSTSQVLNCHTSAGRKNLHDLARVPYVLGEDECDQRDQKIHSVKGKKGSSLRSITSARKRRATVSNRVFVPLDLVPIDDPDVVYHLVSTSSARKAVKLTKKGRKALAKVGNAPQPLQYTAVRHKPVIRSNAPQNRTPTSAERSGNLYQRNPSQRHQDQEPTVHASVHANEPITDALDIFDAILDEHHPVPQVSSKEMIHLKQSVDERNALLQPTSLEETASHDRVLCSATPPVEGQADHQQSTDLLDLKEDHVEYEAANLAEEVDEHTPTGPSDPNSLHQGYMLHDTDKEEQNNQLQSPLTLEQRNLDQHFQTDSYDADKEADLTVDEYFAQTFAEYPTAGQSVSRHSLSPHSQPVTRASALPGATKGRRIKKKRILLPVNEEDDEEEDCEEGQKEEQTEVVMRADEGPLHGTPAAIMHTVGRPGQVAAISGPLSASAREYIRSRLDHPPRSSSVPVASAFSFRGGFRTDIDREACLPRPIKVITNDGARKRARISTVATMEQFRRLHS